MTAKILKCMIAVGFLFSSIVIPVSADDPVPDIKANNSDSDILIQPDDAFSIQVEMNPESRADQDADWWIFVQAYGVGPYYLKARSAWAPGLKTVYQGPLMRVEPLEVSNLALNGSGIIDFYFAVDMDQDGIFPDDDQIICNNVQENDQIFVDKVRVMLEWPRLGQIEKIMREGNSDELDFPLFFLENNSNRLDDFPGIIGFYLEEAVIEGVNPDIAICQMCLETGFLKFGGSVNSNQNNFCGLGAVDDSTSGASFADIQTGVRACIQHLKGYATTDPIVQEIVDPRYHLIEHGIAPIVYDLSCRWATDEEYGNKIIGLLIRLYQSAGLL